MTTEEKNRGGGVGGHENIMNLDYMNAAQK